jgi:hypothetical protein
MRLGPLSRGSTFPVIGSSVRSWIAGSWLSGIWITGRRLRVHGMILALCLWSVYGWNVAAPGMHDHNGNLKGADFSHFYTLGSIGLTHRSADLYDTDAQAKITARRIPGADGITYIPLYPPQVSIFFAPLAALPYGTALVIWLIFSAVVYSLCCYALWRVCPRLRNERSTVLLLAIAFPGFFYLIVWGQTSALALACFTAAFFFLRDARPFLAGLALGCLIFKPQLGIAAALIFLYTRAWRVIAGGMLSAALQLAVPAIYYGREYGRESLTAWMHTMHGVAYNVALLEPRPSQAHSLRIFWVLLVPGRAAPFALYVVSACIVLALIAAVWSRRPALPLSVRYSSLLVASVLVAPHLIVYDLVILAPVFLLLSDWILDRPEAARSISTSSIATLSISTSRMKVVLYLLFLAPLAGGPIAQWTHLQLSVVLMAVSVYLIWRESRRITNSH